MVRVRSTDSSSSKPRARGFAAASYFTKSSLRSASARRGIAETRLVTHWAEIVGPRLARLSRPVRVKHDRAGHGLGGTLIIAVTGARAAEIELEIPQIIDRVNAYYGYRAVVAAKLTQSEPVDPPRAAPPRPQSVDAEALPEPKRRALEALTSDIGDDALRGALTRLGANVMSASKPARRSGDAADAEQG